jgi:ABC-2 type transport system permease protein
MILTLLSVRWLALKNALLRAGAQDRRRSRVNLLLSALIVAVVGAMSYQFITPFVAMAQDNPAIEAILKDFPAFALFSAFWLLLLSAVTVGIQTFYLNQELPLLLSAPVSARAVFGAKFLEATAANTALFLTLGIPLTLSYGMAREFALPLYLPLVAMAMVPFCAVPTGIGLLLSFLLMRVLPAHRTRDVLGALGIAAFAAIYFALSVNVRRMGDTQALQESVSRLAGILSAPLFGTGPWAWAGDAISGAHGSREVAVRLSLLWALAAVTIGITTLAAQWMHWRGWAVAQEAVHPASSAAQGSRSGRWDRLFAPLPGPLRCVLLKDLRTLRRDMRQLSLLFIPIAVVAVFLVNVWQTPQVREVPSVLLGLSMHPILAMISLRLAMSGFVGEGRAMWVMLAAPNPPRSIMISKFLYAFGLSFPLAGIVTVIYCLLQKTSGIGWAANLFLSLAAVAGFCGIGVGASVLVSDFQAESTRFTISAGARIITFLIQMTYLGLLSIVSAAAWALTTLQGLPLLPVLLVSGLALSASAAVCVYAPLVMGAKRLRQMEW